MGNKEKFLHQSQLSGWIADQLEEQIVARGKVGERLDSEQQLCERFDASRTVIREALKILHARGLIQSRAGSGTYIVRPNVQDLSSMIARIIRMDGIDYQSIFDVRYYLEAASVRQVAARGTEADFIALEAILRRLQGEDLDELERRDLDFEFHQSIARMSGNPLLALLVETMANVFKDVIRTGIYVAGGIQDAIVRHQRIMDALRARDPELADRRIREHLEQSRRNYQVYHGVE